MSAAAVDVRSFFEKDFLYAYDLQGREWTLTIAKVVQGKLTGTGGKSTKKPVVYFKGREKGLALNITNVKTVGSMYGFVAADWVGKRITIYPTTTTFGSATVDCIRVKVGVPGAKAQDAPPDPPPAPTEGDPPFDDANGGAP